MVYFVACAQCTHRIMSALIGRSHTESNGSTANVKSQTEEIQQWKHISGGKQITVKMAAHIEIDENKNDECNSTEKSS